MLRETRIRAGLGLRELSRRAGVSPAYLCRVERGKQRASWDLLERLAGPLSCPVEALARPLGVVPPSLLLDARTAWLGGAVRG